ncbi:MAG: shikimate dehydrogenase [Clostridia bacterium]|nr:shikimate dehydrogenase [Clostridia bacterium]
MNYGLIGYPLGHSMSPFIHQKLFENAGFDATYTNHQMPADDPNVRNVIYSFDGFNVTIPHKTFIIKYLEGLRGKAELLKAVNTVVNENGKLYGYNTDCDGFIYSLETAGIELKGNVLLCGSGGAARTMCYLAADAGCDVTVAVRDGFVHEAVFLANEVNSVLGTSVKAICRDELDGGYDLILNATPAGMYPELIDELPVDEKIITRSAAAFDAVYNPRNTKFLKLAESNGAKCAYGIQMLVYQAARAQNIWYGATFSDDFIKNLCDEADREIERRF